MATWIIGDVHGHYETLMQLLDAIEYRSSDKLCFVGDLVNGGGRSADVVRWVADVGAEVTLGNHDLHMLAVWAGARDNRGKDDFDDLLDASDAPELINFMHGRRIVRYFDEFDALVVHAGVHPFWTRDQTVRLGAELETVLREKSSKKFFKKMYGNKPDNWSDDLKGKKRLRVIVNVTTRMRVLSPDGSLDFDYSGVYDEIPKKKVAWFEHPERRTEDTLVVFGHWSALGYKAWSNAIALDSGVRWGGSLSALRLEDRRVVQVPA